MSKKKEMRIALENHNVLLSEGNEVARTYTELCNFDKISVALYLRYAYEDLDASEVFIYITEQSFRLCIDKKLVFEETSSTISVLDGDIVIEDTLLFRHFADNGFIFKLELELGGWSLRVEHIHNN